MIKGLNKKEQLLLIFLFLVLIAGGLLKFITKKDKDIKIYRVIEEESSSEKNENYQKQSYRNRCHERLMSSERGVMTVNSAAMAPSALTPA